VAVGVVAQEIPEGLDGVDRGGTQSFRGRRRLKIFADRLPRSAAQGGQQLAVVQKTQTQDLGDSEHHVPVRHGLDHVAAQPLAELHHALLVVENKRTLNVKEEILINIARNI